MQPAVALGAGSKWHKVKWLWFTDVTSRLDDLFIWEIFGQLLKKKRWNDVQDYVWFFLGGTKQTMTDFLAFCFFLKQDCGCLRSAGSARTTRRRGNLGEMGPLTFEPCNVDQHCNWLSLWWLLVWGCSMELSNISQVIIQLATLRLLTFMHTRQGLKYTYSWQCKQKKKMSQSLICTY